LRYGFGRKGPIAGTTPQGGMLTSPSSATLPNGLIFECRTTGIFARKDRSHGPEMIDGVDTRPGKIPW
jgi:hypothetical protein